MPRKQSSSKLSTLASKVLSGDKKPTVAESKKLAASVLSQDEKKGQRNEAAGCLMQLAHLYDDQGVMLKAIAVLRYAVRMMLPAEGFLALGIVGDAYVVVRKVVESHAIAVAFGVVAAIAFAVLLYGVPLASRRFRARAPAHAGNAS